jgi:hypothetical protein
MDHEWMALRNEEDSNGFDRLDRGIMNNLGQINCLVNNKPTNASHNL